MSIHSMRRLLVRAAVSASLLVTASCASSSVDRTLTELQGRPLAAAVEKLGRPEWTRPTPSGGKTVHWSWIHDSRTVLVEMRVDPKGTIVGGQWRFAGAPGMPANQPGPEHNIRNDPH